MKKLLMYKAFFIVFIPLKSLAFTTSKGEFGNIFGFSFYATANAAFAGTPITDEIQEGTDVDVKYIDIVPYYSAGIVKPITENFLLVLEYSHLENAKNPTDVNPPSSKVPLATVNVKSFYDFQTKLQGAYLGFDYYYTSKAFMGLRLGASYVQTGGDLISDVKVKPFIGKEQQYNIVSPSYGNSYAFSFKLTGGYKLFSVKNIGFDIYSEYMFINNSTVINVTQIDGVLGNQMKENGYPQEFNTGMINQGSLGLRVRY